MIDLSSLNPVVRGKFETNVPMRKHTWFGVGGMAAGVFSPVDSDDLAQFLTQLPQEIAVYPIGAGSNILVRDGGIDGVVILLSGLASIDNEDAVLNVGSGALDADVARAAAKMGLGGLEFLIGIPGTIGGGLRMNAGAYGSEFKDVVIRIEAIDRKGNHHTADVADLGMGYRNTNAPNDWIFTKAVLRTVPDDRDAIRARMKKIIASRGEAQPRGVRTGGSTFANPEGHKAWQLIDAADCRGKAIGNAAVSDKHCNFLINRGGATAADIETLGEEVRSQVKAKSGIELRWEIRRLGIKEEARHD